MLEEAAAASEDGARRQSVRGPLRVYSLGTGRFGFDLGSTRRWSSRFDWRCAKPAIRMNGEVDASRFVAEPREGERSEARVDCRGVVTIAAEVANLTDYWIVLSFARRRWLRSPQT